MKIQGTDKSGKSSGSKKTGKASSSGASFGTFLSPADVSDSPTVSQGQSVNRIEALLVAQATEDPTERASRGRMRQRADKLLDELESIRMTLLRGDLTVGHLLNLADLAATHQENINDPQLSEILAEIDLRAQVELAKMRVSLNQVI